MKDRIAALKIWISKKADLNRDRKQIDKYLFSYHHLKLKK